VPQSRPLREIPLKVQKSFSHRSLASGVAAQGSGIVATDKERDAPAKGTQTEATAYINDLARIAGSMIQTRRIRTRDLIEEGEKAEIARTPVPVAFDPIATFCRPRLGARSHRIPLA